MGHFVTLGDGDFLLGLKICILRVQQEGGGPAGDETPIFHCTSTKVVGLEKVRVIQKS